MAIESRSQTVGGQPAKTARRLTTLLAAAVLAALASTLAVAAPASAHHTEARSVIVEGNDLYNGMSYSVHGQQVEVRNGRGTIEFPWHDTDSEFTIRGHLYGDITGDGTTDAAVWGSYPTTMHDGRERVMDGVWVVRDASGNTPTMLGPTWIGGGAYGGLEYAEIRDGYLEVSVFAGSEMCCPTAVTTNRWIASGDRLVPVERSASVTYLDLTKHDEDQVPALMFAPQTSSAIIESNPANGSRSFTFEAQARQSVHVRTRWGQADVRIRRLDTGAVIATLRHDQDVNVPVDGRYLAEVHPSPATSGQASFELTVASRRGLYSPTWTPRSFSDDSVGEITAQWPELKTAHPGVDIAKVNGLIRDVVDDEIASFRKATARQDHAENQESSLWVTYELTLTAYDLISLQLHVGRSLCCTEGASRHSVERHALTIDLNREQVINLDDLVSPAMYDQLPAGWWHALQHDSSYLIEHGHATEPAADHEWSGALLGPNGLTLMSNAANGGEHMAVLTWDRLAALDASDANEVARRLEHRSSSAIRVPAQMDECGC